MAAGIAAVCVFASRHLPRRSCIISVCSTRSEDRGLCTSYSVVHTRVSAAVHSGQIDRKEQDPVYRQARRQEQSSWSADFRSGCVCVGGGLIFKLLLYVDWLTSVNVLCSIIVDF